jgi:hypothetical protein
VPPVLPELLVQALAAAVEVELVPPFCRTLQRLASKRRGLFPTIKRFSFSFWVHLLSRHISEKNVLLDDFLLHKSRVLASGFREKQKRMMPLASEPWGGSAPGRRSQKLGKPVNKVTTSKFFTVEGITEDSKRWRDIVILLFPWNTTWYLLLHFMRRN